MEARNISDSRNPKRKPPQNPIIGKARADKWDAQLSGLIVDQDIIATKAELIATQLKSRNQWALIRDVIIVLLLLTLIGLTIWRAILTDQRLAGCAGGVVTLPFPAKD